MLWEGRCRDDAGLKLADGRETDDGPTNSGARLERQGWPSGREGDGKSMKSVEVKIKTRLCDLSPDLTTSSRGDLAAFIGTELRNNQSRDPSADKNHVLNVFNNNINDSMGQPGRCNGH